MNFSDMTFSTETVRWLVTVALGIYSWFIGRQAASAAELLDLRTRITTLEADMKQVPSQQQLHALALNVSDLRGSVEAMGQRIDPLVRVMDRIETHLLNKKD
ncbi:DUF2730 family protein [Comamonas sp. EJ-4]|uniref:DUF2730 family protein n=2 Tax=Comamonas suwonensis TaxID=2606214 RepID=A0A843BCT5_9BURK|nr:DUF2730 family protein [Comamonas suwonensis]